MSHYTEEQYDAFAKKMEEAYPEMFAQPYGGFCVGVGWWPILESLCANIQSHINHVKKTRERLLVDNPYNHKIPDDVEQVVVAQIKEKFGGLRFYYDGGDEQVYGMVRMAEAWADKHCEICGKPGKSRNTGWIKTLCDEHAAEREAEYKARFGDD
jgi:hypothetical protein